jgi:hypothetical protein
MQTPIVEHPNIVVFKNLAYFGVFLTILVLISIYQKNH